MFADTRLLVESMDLDGQGVARRTDGKVVFIEGALPGERVSVNVNRKKSSFEQATLTALHTESAQRVQPGCPHFGLHTGACGGCKVQHLHAAAQVAVKQRVLEDNLARLGSVKPELMLRPIEGPTWGYRYRARLSVRYVLKKGTALIGFHERKSSYVADMRQCPVLPPIVSSWLEPLRELIGSLQARDKFPQLELACGEDTNGTDTAVIALVLRHLVPLNEADAQRLREFALAHPPLQWWLQPKGPETVHLLDAPAADAPTLAYTLPEFGITMPFLPTDFTQVNPFINRVLVSRALRLLAAQKHERVIDWFCGLGNFTLPLATQAREVLGVEGSETLVARARLNLALNQVKGQRENAFAATQFSAKNLFEITPEELVQCGAAEKWLVDPPRDGAFALVKALADLCVQHADVSRAKPHWQPPRRIVYVSCNPATLARDAQLLVHVAGYRCTAAGVVNMFPHTAHVESMAVFERA
ncbi:MAG: 23S rRNA (uracil(1939)-C(5))-methyltransferase RlmD [Burkholderiales bacterium]